MKATKIIIWITAPIIFVLLSSWAINNYINDKILNEDKATLFDECMSASYLHISEIAEWLLINIDFRKEVAQKVNMEHPLIFKNDFIIAYNDELENNPLARDADLKLYTNQSFMSSAVACYLCDGGRLREEESMAFNQFISVWCEIQHPELDSYESYMERLDVLKKVLNEAMPLMRKSIKSYSNDVNAYRAIDPLDKQYIWERHNARKNWPFNFSNN